MVISELIEELERLKEIHGDIGVEYACEDEYEMPDSAEIHDFDVNIRSTTSGNDTYIEKFIVIS